MRVKHVCAALAVCLAVPAAVLAFGHDSGRALFCDSGDNPVCGLYRVCKPILDSYPASEITARGKDCTLTVGSRQLIIRRKLTGDEDGYFFYVNRTDVGKTGARP
ncbi:MAG: hypothetical protein HY952_01890 [Elusimicrobia bacterium]|nr:hypothetical protein [Elusimicrobiota bacterium]